MECPFCTGNPGLHLGIHEDKNYCFCWRCGYHRLEDTLSKLLNVSRREAKELIIKYGGKSLSRNKPATVIKPKVKKFKLPSNCGPLQQRHRMYLLKRKFDPDQIEQNWKIVGTGPVSFLDGKDYKHRIIIPIMWDGKMVSFQGRDITGKTELRYKACPKDRELIEHQTILYGNQTKWKDTGICVEGVTDVWRLGPLSFAVFGISFTPSQVRIISKSFRRVVILFDDDPQAQQQADKLLGELRFRGVKTWKESIVEDPASLKQEDADSLVKELTKRIH